MRMFNWFVGHTIIYVLYYHVDLQENEMCMDNTSNFTLHYDFYENI